MSLLIEHTLRPPYKCRVDQLKRTAYIFDTRPVMQGIMPVAPDSIIREGYVGRVWIDHTGAWNQEASDKRVTFLPINEVLPLLSYGAPVDLGSFQEFVLELTTLEQRAYRMGLIETAHKINATIQKAGWEQAQKLTKVQIAEKRKQATQKRHRVIRALVAKGYKIERTGREWHVWHPTLKPGTTAVYGKLSEIDVNDPI